MQSTLLGYVLAAGWLPLLATTLIVGATWVIWYYAIGPGVEGSAAARLCTRAPLACYIVPAVWRDCVLHGVAAITLTGGPDIMLFIRERRRNQRAEELRQQEKQAEQERYQQERKEAAELRQQERKEAEELRQQERKEAAERYEREQQREQERHNQVIGLLQAALEQANTERRQAEERYRQDQQRAEDRAAANQQAFLNTLTAVLARNGNGANGNGAPE